MTEEETAYEHNMRYSKAIEDHVIAVEEAELLLKKCDYRVFTKKEFEQRHRVHNVIVILISLTSIGLGFSICMAFKGVM